MSIGLKMYLHPLKKKPKGSLSTRRLFDFLYFQTSFTLQVFTPISEYSGQYPAKVVTVNTAATSNAISPNVPEMTLEKYKPTNVAASNNLIP